MQLVVQVLLQQQAVYRAFNEALSVSSQLLVFTPQIWCQACKVLSLQGACWLVSGAPYPIVQLVMLVMQ